MCFAAVCEKCGAIGVKHAFYTKERRFCSLACAREYSELERTGQTIPKPYPLLSVSNLLIYITDLYACRTTTSCRNVMLLQLGISHLLLLVAVHKFERSFLFAAVYHVLAYACACTCVHNILKMQAMCTYIMLFFFQ